jgi:cyclic pyranopterin phosphate synthase
MTDSQTSIAKVLEGIDMARRCGLEPVKINMVVQRGVNEHSVLPMAQWARSEGLELRYIEYMDVGRTNGWREEDVFTAAEIRDKIHQQWPVEPVETADTPATAQRFRYRDGQGEFGIIASVSRPFCRGCTRARVSSYGELYPCLFASTGLDLATPLRHGQELRPLITKLWRQRGDRYSELRSDVPSYSPRPEMSAIGG